jgi:Holliday junction resolvase-like predicted endonuclease
LIAVKDWLLVFVEVKDVTWSDIFINPLSKSKMSALKRSIFHYVQKIGYSGDIRCDCFFVKNNHIIERFEWIIFE